jgi:putative membrane protein
VSVGVNKLPARPGARSGARPQAPGQARPPGRTVPVICLAIFTIVWTALAIAPRDRDDWLLENLPTFVAIPAAVFGYRRFRFSNRAYIQATLFLVLHTIGSHYTYSEVPLGDWTRDVLGLSRNHYDRVVHFAFGLLLLCPVRELGFRGRARPGSFAVLYFSAAGVACWSLVYEIVEWLVAAVADPAAGTAYLGTQGDVWDAQKDMMLALWGAGIAALVERRLDRRPDVGSEAGATEAIRTTNPCSGLQAETPPRPHARGR